MKKISESQQKELEYKKDWCLIVLDFIIGQNGADPIMKQMKDVVLETFSQQNVRGMQYAYNDINEMAKGLALVEQKQLNELLKNKMVPGLEQLDREEVHAVDLIIKNGRIANEDDYRLVLRYVDRIHDDMDKQARVQQLNILLSSYP